MERLSQVMDRRLSWEMLQHVTLVRESRYPVATSYKSVTNDRNYYLINGHYILGMYKSNY